MIDVSNSSTASVRLGVDHTYYLDEYAKVLMGERKNFPPSLMARGNGPDQCAALLRDIFRCYLHWTPEDIRDKLNADVIAQMKLGPLINRIPCPPEIDPKTEFYYVAWYLYPQVRNIEEPELIIKLYNDILSGKVRKFPASYFDGNAGYLRARILLMTMIREYLPPVQNIEALYRFFASPEGKRCIYNYKLTVPLNELYGSPVAYLHDALPNSQKNERLYEKYERISASERMENKFLPVTELEMRDIMGLDTRSDDELFSMETVEDDSGDDTGAIILDLDGDDNFVEEIGI